MPFVEDLSGFFKVSDFGTAALYNGATTVNGIFDAAYADPLGLAEGTAPVFMCATASVPAAAHGDTLVINGVTYTVRGVEPDASGLVVMLRLQAP
jgi:hypothetical protein